MTRPVNDEFDLLVGKPTPVERTLLDVMFRMNPGEFIEDYLKRMETEYNIRLDLISPYMRGLVAIEDP